jgi:hypothetical protein
MIAGDPNLDLQESGWEELRREARKIEGDLDVKLSSYAKLGARFTQGGTHFLVLLQFLSLFVFSAFSTFYIAFWDIRGIGIDGSALGLEIFFG